MALLSVLRMLAFLISLLLVQVVALVLWPVTLTNPLWRSLGLSEDQLPLNVVFPKLARFVLFCSGVWVTVDDRASRTAKTQVIYMYNHTSNLDPIVVQSVASCKFVYKRELKFVPLFGWVMFLYRHISIDRKNREQAIESLNRAVRKVVAKHQNVAIAPEGTRSKSGALLEFKKGPFHLAVQSKAKIVPVVISGAHAILPPKSFALKGGHISVRLLEPISTEGKDVDALRDQVRRVFEKALGDPTSPLAHPVQPSRFLTALPALLLAAIPVVVLLSRW